MDLSSSPLLRYVLDLIHKANYTLDRNHIRKQVLNIFLKGFYNHGAVFFLPDDGAMFSNIIINNLDETYSQYFQEYYHRFDPLHLIEESPVKAFAGPIARRISYDFMRSTEYYNDFLKPQKIHHKLVVYLESMEGVQGKVVLTRPAGYSNFSSHDIELARTISPYMAHVLSLNNLRSKITQVGDVLNIIDNEFSIGIILIDDDMRLVYMNQKAAGLCSEAFGTAVSPHACWYIDPHLMETIRHLIKGQRNEADKAEQLPLSHNFAVAANNKVKLSLTVKPIQKGTALDSYHIIYISKLNHNVSVSESVNRQMFQLTQRELDVMSHIFRGLKNSEIAGELFISEITVKKHIQKIYAKVGVKNRTSLMNKVLSLKGSLN